MDHLKNRIRRVAGEHWRVRRVLLLVLVLTTMLGLVTVQSMGEAVEPRHVYVVLNADGSRTIISGRPSRSQSFGELLVARVDYQSREAQLQLEPGYLVTVVDGADSQTVETRDETVDHLLRRVGLSPNPDEMIFLDFTQGDLRIYFRTEMSEQRSVTLSVDYSTRRRVNHLLKKGEERVVQTGVPGAITYTYTDTYRLGQVVSTELTDTATDGAREEIVEYGTRVSSVDRSDSLVSVHYNDDGSGYLLFASGDSMTFSRALTCSASAYSIGNRTASGRPTAVGNIAVDTDVFPYGTRMYVQTQSGSWHYGMATAADCGSSIRGNKIDLWFESYAEACNWGRRDCTVYVLD